MFFQLTCSHARVTVDGGLVLKTLLLKFSRANDAFANGSGTFLGSFAGNVAIFDGRHLDVQIDPMKQRAGNALTVTLHLQRAAPAFALKIAEVAAGTWVHCSHQHELGWKRDTACGARHSYFPVL